MNRKKTVLITGANAGMGKALSLELALRGYRVFMLCRDKKRGQAALEDILASSGNPDVSLELCDLASFESIRRFTSDFVAREKSLDILVNNAGVILPRRHETADGNELQFGVNHLGHFLLTRRLYPLLSKSPAARIVIVSSGAHRIGKIHFDDVNLTKAYSIWKAYGQSKLANVLFCFELARKLRGKTITANCLHPGGVATDFGVNRETGFGKTIMRIAGLILRSPKQGADTALYLCDSDTVEGLTGQYLSNRKVKRASKSARDPEIAKRLWDLSESMTGETFEP